MNVSDMKISYFPQPRHKKVEACCYVTYLSANAFTKNILSFLPKADTCISGIKFYNIIEINGKAKLSYNRHVQRTSIIYFEKDIFV